MKYFYFSVAICVCLLQSCVRQESNLFRIAVNDLFGYIDDQGGVIIEPKFTYASDFHEGLAYARTDSVIGYINMKGQYEFSVTIKKEKQSTFKKDSTGQILRDSIWITNSPIHEKDRKSVV